ncbi:MAG: glycosyltransferase family 2 protein [Phycisphaerae bacterium]
MPTDPIVSIVVPTFNRLRRLTTCIQKIQENVAVPHEIIVVDGGSSDGSRDWLNARTDVNVILETAREGAVRAFNKGFRAASATYVMWINDDAYPLVGSVEAALAMFERENLPDLGMVAFYHNWHSPFNVLDRVWHDDMSFELCHVRGYPYANFGLIRKSLLERIGYADERYYFFAFDPDLSLKVQLNEGLEVIGCRNALIRHEEFHDDRKTQDLNPGKADNEKLFAKWNLPPKDAYPDPTPAYLAMLAQRNLLFETEPTV